MSSPKVTRIGHTRNSPAGARLMPYHRRAMPSQQVVTFCRICEAHCGMVATVDDGRVTKLRPDPDHPLSRGYACPKGIAMSDVQNDPDRVTHPLRRRPDGEFERVGHRDPLRARVAAARPRSAGTWATRA